MMHVVVVGGGVAGTSCAASVIAHARLHEARLRVTVVSASADVSVGVPLLTTSRARDVNVHSQRGVSWAGELGVEFKHARAIALEKGVLRTDDGVVRFDALCVASGAAPVVPEVLRGVAYTVRDASSVRELQGALEGARDVLVVGNGGVALEIVHAIYAARVVWAFRDSHPGAAFFDERAAVAVLAPGRTAAGGTAAGGTAAAVAAVKAAGDAALGAALGPFWERAGRLRGALKEDEGCVTRRPGSKVIRIEEKGEEKYVILSDGSTVRFDVIVCGTGVAPSVSWLLKSGIRMIADRNGHAGVYIEAGTMRSSQQGVYAAGDCSVVKKGEIGHDWYQRCLWTQASAAGGAAGRSIVADLKAKQVEVGMEFELFAHATRFFAIRVVFLGRYAAQGLEDGYTMLEDDGVDGFVRVVLLDGRMRGALLVGDVTDRAEAYENLILNMLQVAHLGHALLHHHISDYFD